MMRGWRALRLAIATLHLCASLLAVMPQGLASSQPVPDGWIEICTGTGMQLVRIDPAPAGQQSDDKAPVQPLSSPPLCPLCVVNAHLVAVPAGQTIVPQPAFFPAARPQALPVTDLPQEARRFIRPHPTGPPLFL